MARSRVRVEVNLNRLTEEIGPAVQARLREAAQAGSADAKRRAPVDTGRLRDSIHVEDLPDYGARYGTNVEYGIYQELGTYKMRAQPFLRPSMDTVRANLRRH